MGTAANTVVDLNPLTLPVSYPVSARVTSPRWLTAAIAMGIPQSAQTLAKAVSGGQHPQSAKHQTSESEKQRVTISIKYLYSESRLELFFFFAYLHLLIYWLK